MGKKYNDMNTVLSIMDKTFINRRDWIKSEGVSVKAAIETYPALATIEGVSLWDVVSCMIHFE